MMATMSEDQPTPVPSKISTLDSQQKSDMRAVLVKGVEYLTQILHDKMREDPSVFNFADLELAVNTDNLLSTNCPLLETNELAHFVRFTEVPGDSFPKGLTPRSLTVGVVLSFQLGRDFYPPPPSGKFCPIRRRIWDAYPVSWVGSDKLLSETSKDLIPKIQTALLDAIHTACMDYAENGCDMEEPVSKINFTNKDAAVRMKTE